MDGLPITHTLLHFNNYAWTLARLLTILFLGHTGIQVLMKGKLLRTLMRTEVKMNDRKIEILIHMSDGDWWTSNEIALWCGLSLTNASELLRRYRSQGLVNRVRNYDVPRGYRYRITHVGLERLQYLYSPVMKTSSTIANLAGLSGTNKRVLNGFVKRKLRR